MELHTPRLALRTWRDEDIARYAEICTDLDVMRYMPEGKPLSYAESERKIEKMRRHWEEHGHGWWALEERATRALVGRVGLTLLPQPGAQGQPLPAIEIGWLLAKGHWGRGLATEAATAARDHAFSALGAGCLHAAAQEANTPSLRVMERLDMTRTGRDVRRGHEVVTYELPRTAWHPADIFLT